MEVRNSLREKMLKESETFETSNLLVAESSDKAEIPDAPIGEPIFRYPLWWTTFIMFQREGCSATESYQRSRPDLHLTYANYSRKASLLLQDRDFKKLLTQLEAGTIGEVEQWKRTTMARVNKWRYQIDKQKVKTPKDISLLTSSEKTLHEMGNKVLGIRDDQPAVQVQVNVAGIIAGIEREAETGTMKPLPKDIVQRFKAGQK